MESSRMSVSTGKLYRGRQLYGCNTGVSGRGWKRTNLPDIRGRWGQSRFYSTYIRLLDIPFEGVEDLKCAVDYLTTLPYVEQGKEGGYRAMCRCRIYSREALKILLLKNEGVIINIPSVNRERPFCGAAYTATEGALNTLF